MAGFLIIAIIKSPPFPYSQILLTVFPYPSHQVSSSSV